MIFKKFECERCKKKYPKRKMLTYGGKHFCSESCMVSFITGISSEELKALCENTQKIFRRM